jgi:hypothetical protein
MTQPNDGADPDLMAMQTFDAAEQATLRDAETERDLPRRILDTPLPDNDAQAATIRDYLIELLATLWTEGEGFSGKRPFGNSSWEYDLYRPLIRAGLVDGTLDEYGDVDRVDHQAADALIEAAIRSLATPGDTTEYGVFQIHPAGHANLVETYEDQAEAQEFIHGIQHAAANSINAADIGTPTYEIRERRTWTSDWKAST